ncbi:MAG TPA: coproporphyrinogen III oxidase, partial [Puia sp.]
LALRKGYFLSEEDRVFRRHILEIATTGRTVLDPAWVKEYAEWTLPQLRILEEDELVVVEQGCVVRVTEKGAGVVTACLQGFRPAFAEG